MDSKPLTERTSFGQALYAIRTKEGVKRDEIARLCKVTVKAVRLWERGDVYPVRETYEKLVSLMPELRHTPPPALTDRKSPSGGDIEKKIPVAAARASLGRRSHSFGEALRKHRVANALSQDDLSQLMGVAERSAAQWESEKCVPVREHYEKLLEIFPGLRLEPEPDWKDIPKPNGNTTGNPHVVHGPPTPRPEAPTPAPTPTPPPPAQEPPMASTNAAPAPAIALAPPPPATSARDWVNLLVRVRAIEAADGKAAVVGLLAEAKRLGVGIDDLLLLLEPNP